jgi:hypothetical protein
LLSRPICFIVFPSTYGSCFIVSGLVWKLLIHFKMIFVQSKRQGSTLSFLQQYLLKRLLSSCILDSFANMDSYLGLLLHTLFFISGFFCLFVSSIMLFLLLWQ